MSAIRKVIELQVINDRLIEALEQTRKAIEKYNEGKGLLSVAWDIIHETLIDVKGGRK